MDCDQVRISFSVEPDHCILRLGGALGVAGAEELRLAALELAAYHKDVVVDWSGATQLDAGIAQVLLSLRAGLSEQNKSLTSCAPIPPPVKSWLRTAGLSDVLGEPGRGA
jgi:anti-anti-sigma regulatory factor